MKLLLFFSILLIILPPVYLNNVHAQEHSKINLEISPAKFDYFLEPGTEKTGEIVIRNSGGEPAQVNIYVQDYNINSEKIEFNNQNKYSNASWIQLSDNEIELPVNSYKKITFAIRVPDNALPGAHWSVVFFETVEHGKGGVGRGARIGANILTTIKGDAISKGTVLDYNISSFSNRSINYSFIIENKGNVFLNVNPKLVVKSKNNFVERLLLEEVAVYPDTTRSITGVWDSPKPYGIYELNFEIDYGEFKERFQKKVLILPWHWGIALLGIIISLFVRQKILHRPKNKKIKNNNIKTIDTSNSMLPKVSLKEKATIENDVRNHSLSRSNSLKRKKLKLVLGGYNISQVEKYVDELDRILLNIQHENKQLQEELHYLKQSNNNGSM